MWVLQVSLDPGQPGKEQRVLEASGPWGGTETRDMCGGGQELKDKGHKIGLLHRDLQLEN